jgi:hypothetical protein
MERRTIMTQRLFLCLLLAAHVVLSKSGLTVQRGEVIAELKRHFQLKSVLLLHDVGHHNSCK